MAEEGRKPGIVLHGFPTRYSGWTARVVLVLEHFGIPYKSRCFTFAEHYQRPVGDRLRGCLLPSLQPDPQDSDFFIGESLAICEYLAEAYPELHLWPRDAKLRAKARTAAAQMHSGFNAIRNSYCSNFLAKYEGNIPMTDAAAKEIRKMIGIWNDSRAETKKRLQQLGVEDEGYLFGTFSIADAFFWPVLWRFRSYQLPLDGITEDGVNWMATMWEDPVIVAQAHDYFEQAKDPRTFVEHYEDIFKDDPEIRYSQFDEDWKFMP